MSPRPQQQAAGTRVLRNRPRRRVTPVRVDRLVRLLSVVVTGCDDDGGVVPTATSALEVVDDRYVYG